MTAPAEAARSRRNAHTGRNLRRRNKTSPAQQPLGLRERKKARLREQIIETALRLFRKQGYENTRIDDIVKILEISQPTFFRYFPSKDAVLRDVGKRGFACIVESLAVGAAFADSEGTRRPGFGNQARCAHHQGQRKNKQSAALRSRRSTKS